MGCDCLFAVGAWKCHTKGFFFVVKRCLLFKKKKSALCGNHFCPSMTCYKRRNHLQDFHEKRHEVFFFNLLRKCEFCDNRLCDNHTLLQGLNLFLPLVSTLLDRFRWNAMQKLFIWWVQLELRRNLCCDIHAFLKDANEAFLVQLLYGLIQKVYTQCRWVVASASERYTFFAGVNEIYPEFSAFSVWFGYVHKRLLSCEPRKQWQDERRTLFRGAN